MKSFLSGPLKTALKLGVSIAVKAVIASAVTALPILGLPGINAAFSWIVNWVALELTENFEEWLAETIIEVEVDAEKRAYAKASEILKSTLESQGKNGKDIQEASDEFDKRLADLIRIRS